MTQSIALSFDTPTETTAVERSSLGFAYLFLSRGPVPKKWQQSTGSRTAWCSMPSISCFLMAGTGAENRCWSGGPGERLIDKDLCGAIQFRDHYDGEGIDLFKGACDMGLEGIVSKRTSASYRSGASRFWLNTKNTVESELVLLGTDYDNEGKPIAYLGKESSGELQFAGTAFLTLPGKPKDELQKRVGKLLTSRPPVPQRTWRKPQ